MKLEKSVTNNFGIDAIVVVIFVVVVVVRILITVMLKFVRVAATTVFALYVNLISSVSVIIGVFVRLDNATDNDVNKGLKLEIRSLCC